jgi:multiple sugar transport system substrate-binding protein
MDKREHGGVNGTIDDRETVGRRVDRRGVLKGVAGAGLALGLGSRLGGGSAAQTPISYSKDYAGTTLNMLMEDLSETTIIESLLPDFKDKTGIDVAFEKVNYNVMHEKLVPQLAAGAGNGSYDCLEVDFYWVYEFARSGWVEELGPRIQASKGQVDLSRYIPATLKINSEVDGKTYYVPMYPYPMGLLYRNDLLDDAAFKDAYKAVAGKDLALPDSVDGYVEVAKNISKMNKGVYGAAMQAAQPDPIVMEFCNFLYGMGGDYYDEGLTKPIVNDATGVKALTAYVDCVQHAAQPGAAGADLNDTMATYLQAKAFSMISYVLFMLNNFQNDPTSKVKGKSGIVTMPGGKGLTGAWSWGIPISSPNPDAAWEYIKWVESPDIAMKRAIAGGVPSQLAPYDNAEFLQKYPWMKDAKDLIASGKGLPAVTKQTQLVEIMGRHLSDAVSGGASPQDAMNAAADELKGLL